MISPRFSRSGFSLKHLLALGFLAFLGYLFLYSFLVAGYGAAAIHAGQKHCFSEQIRILGAAEMCILDRGASEPCHLPLLLEKQYLKTPPDCPFDGEYVVWLDGSDPRTICSKHGSSISPPPQPYCPSQRVFYWFRRFVGM
jgi:hypothetical protein